MANPIDLFVGKRLRQRRRVLGLTQQKLADEVNIRFQQIQKYESGANRVSASRLWALANAMDTPVSYFFEDLPEIDGNSAMSETSIETDTGGAAALEPQVLSNKETIDLVRAYYHLSEEPRRRLLDLAKTLAGAA